LEHVFGAFRYISNYQHDTIKSGASVENICILVGLDHSLKETTAHEEDPATKIPLILSHHLLVLDTGQM